MKFTVINESKEMLFPDIFVGQFFRYLDSKEFYQKVSPISAFGGSKQLWEYPSHFSNTKYSVYDGIEIQLQPCK